MVTTALDSFSIGNVKLSLCINFAILLWEPLSTKFYKIVCVIECSATAKSSKINTHPAPDTGP